MNEQWNQHNNDNIELLRSQIERLKQKNLELEKQIRIKESLYLSVLDALPINIFLEDPEGRTIFANRNACEIHGLKTDDLIGKTVFDFFPQHIAEINRAYDMEVWKQRKLITKEVPAGFKGETHHMFTGKTILHINESNQDFLLGFGLDITDRVRVEDKLKESEEKFRNVIEQAADSIFLIGTNGMLIDLNPIACEVLGYSKNELLQMNIDSLFKSLAMELNSLVLNDENHSIANLEDYLISKGQVYVPVDINIRLIKIGDKKVYVALCRDIREKKRAEAQIEHMAFHDALTDLPNRWYIQSYINHYISNQNNTKERLGFILLDLDYFKVINDSLGHDAGDMLLMEVAHRLQMTINNTKNILARFGGDEFIILLPHITNEQEVLSLSDNINSQLSKPFIILGDKFNISASIGISLYPTDGEDLNSLIKNADLAMYHSKEKGRGCFSLYNPIMKMKAIERMDLDIQLREALKSTDFFLHYQPKLNLKTGQVNGMEALIRWKNQHNRILYPDSFIQIAEETGLINQLGEWVLREACFQCKEWHDRGYNDLTISVNISPKQFQQNNLEELIISVLDETGLPPWSLELELTEGIVMKDPEAAVHVLTKLKDLGIKISIDDFGTGFSSLSYLKLFPIDTLKIDKSFIMNLGEDMPSSKIVLAIISLAHSLNLDVVAEGVENLEQFDFLMESDCDVAQGYFISKPQLPEDIINNMDDFQLIKK
ncbi:sensor domain-containing protein [Bacillus marasmi]|uniref:sensor domain-containing protein n=1 Tax=Bacillus marasmi TaxID=1926279 RepID=UPI0011CA7657|nr:bifunctional diguanylate cyclase/phosphodiesterase [Bacillus marasmi]